MTGWGMAVGGLDAVFDLFGEIQTAWDGGTLYITAPTVDYAVYQELGTSSIEARPFMRPAAERVQSDPERYAKQVAAAQGIDISTEEGFVRALALAVEREAKQIANAKGVRDTGALIASITHQRVK